MRSPQHLAAGGGLYRDGPLPRILRGCPDQQPAPHTGVHTGDAVFCRRLVGLLCERPGTPAESSTLRDGGCFLFSHSKRRVRGKTCRRGETRSPPADSAQYGAPALQLGWWGFRRSCSSPPASPLPRLWARCMPTRPATTSPAAVARGCGWRQRPTP